MNNWSDIPWARIAVKGLSDKDPILSIYSNDMFWIPQCHNVFIIKRNSLFTAMQFIIDISKKILFTQNMNIYKLFSDFKLVIHWGYVSWCNRIREDAVRRGEAWSLPFQPPRLDDPFARGQVQVVIAINEGWLLVVQWNKEENIWQRANIHQQQ